MTEEKKLKPGDTCPACNGTGYKWLEGDAHKSSGWIPCGYSNSKPHPKWGKVVDLRCANGVMR